MFKNNLLVFFTNRAWLGEWNVVLLRMSRKVELHTGLSALYTETNSHAEPWQVGFDLITYLFIWFMCFDKFKNFCSYSGGI